MDNFTFAVEATFAGFVRPQMMLWSRAVFGLRVGFRCGCRWQPNDHEPCPLVHGSWVQAEFSAIPGRSWEFIFESFMATLVFVFALASKSFFCASVLSRNLHTWGSYTQVFSSDVGFDMVDF